MFDCVVIGGGPAGLTAALYLARYRRSVALIDAGKSRARYIPKSHNCPGFPAGIAGPALIKRMHAQAAAAGVTLIHGSVATLRLAGQRFVASDGQNRWRARSIVLATGIEDALPAIAGIERAIRNGVVRLCPICDAYEAIDKHIAVLGVAPTIAGHARFLRTYSASVSAILATSQRLSSAHEARLRADRIPVLGQVAEWSLTGHGVAARIDGETYEFDHLYVATGSRPKADLDRQIGARRDRFGQLIVNDRMATSIAGVYAIGDGIGALNQVSTAVGQAAIAATTIHRSLPHNYVRK